MPEITLQLRPRFPIIRAQSEQPEPTLPPLFFHHSTMVNAWSRHLTTRHRELWRRTGPRAEIWFNTYTFYTGRRSVRLDSNLAITLWQGYDQIYRRIASKLQGRNWARRTKRAQQPLSYAFIDHDSSTIRSFSHNSRHYKLPARLAEFKHLIDHRYRSYGQPLVGGDTSLPSEQLPHIHSLILIGPDQSRRFREMVQEISLSTPRWASELGFPLRTFYAIRVPPCVVSRVIDYSSKLLKSSNQMTFGMCGPELRPKIH
jgi:hypothetical protein